MTCRSCVYQTYLSQHKLIFVINHLLSLYNIRKSESTASVVVRCRSTMKLIILCVSIVSTLSSPVEKLHWGRIPQKNSESRIINGEVASLGQFPWQAAMYVRGYNFNWFCGGSIISQDWILTAGHCVYGAAEATIIAGLIDLEGEVGTSIQVNTFIVHEEYNGAIILNDIGLAKLSTSLVFNEYTKPIQLADNPLNAGTQITVSGWGKTSDGSIPVNAMLRFVDVVTITTSQCEETYGKGEVFDGIVCAVSGQAIVTSPCNGDSGGPGMINLDSDPIHVAIVSFVSDRGCEMGHPSGYTRTAFYRDWIREKTDV